MHKHIHIHIHIHIHTYTHTHTPTHTSPYIIHIHLHMHRHTHMDTDPTHTRSHTFTHLSAQRHSHTSTVPAHKSIHIHLHIQTWIGICMYVYLCAYVRVELLPMCMCYACSPPPTLSPHLHKRPMSPPATPISCARILPACCFRPSLPCALGHVEPVDRPHLGRIQRAHRDRPGARAGRGQPRGQGQCRPTRTGGALCRYGRRRGKGLKTCMDTSCLWLGKGGGGARQEGL